MSSDDKREQAREAFNDAVANGQVHPAVANYLAALDDDLRGAQDNHNALADDLARQEQERRDREVQLSDDDKAALDRAGDDATPAKTAKPTPAAVAANKTGGNAR